MRSREDQPCVQRCFGNVSSPVSAVLLLLLLAHRFLCQSCPPPRARQDSNLHNTTLFSLDCHHPSAWYPSCPDPFTVWFASSQSFIHSRLLLRAVLFGSLRYPAQTEKQGNFFPPLSLFFRIKETPLEPLKNWQFWRIVDRYKRDERGQSQSFNILFYASTTRSLERIQQNALWCLKKKNHLALRKVSPRWNKGTFKKKKKSN